MATLQIRELLEEQEQWNREFQQELEEEERARVSAQHQEQEQHQDKTRWVPTPSISDSEPTPEAYKAPNEPPNDTTSPYDDGWLNPEHTPSVLYQPPTPIPNGADPTPQLKYSRYDMENEYHKCVVMFDGCEPNDGANMEPKHDNTIEWLMRELVVSDDAMRGWAEEMEGIGLTQGEYTQANYSAPPALPSPAPQDQPPPITIYLPPPINYMPPPSCHRPPYAWNTSRHPPFRSHTCP